MDPKYVLSLQTSFFYRFGGFFLKFLHSFGSFLHQDSSPTPTPKSIYWSALADVKVELNQNERKSWSVQDPTAAWGFVLNPGFAGTAGDRVQWPVHFKWPAALFQSSKGRHTSIKCRHFSFYSNYTILIHGDFETNSNLVPTCWEFRLGHWIWNLKVELGHSLCSAPTFPESGGQQQQKNSWFLLVIQGPYLAGAMAISGTNTKKRMRLSSHRKKHCAEPSRRGRRRQGLGPSWPPNTNFAAESEKLGRIFNEFVPRLRLKSSTFEIGLGPSD